MSDHDPGGLPGVPKLDFDQPPGFDRTYGPEYEQKSRWEVGLRETKSDRALRLVKEYVSLSIFVVLSLSIAAYMFYTVLWHVGTPEDQAWSRTLLTAAFTGYLGWMLKR